VAHRANVRRNQERQRRENRARLVAYLLEHPCVDCGEADLRVLDFDHRDPSTKRATVGVLLGSCGWARVLAEIAECDVRCANCHRRRTAEDHAWTRHAAETSARAATAAAGTARLAAVLPPQPRGGPVEVAPGVYRPAR
jgi:hypothetical protein